MQHSAGRLSVLHVLLSIGETSAPYNEHCLALAHKRDIGVCTYFRPAVVPPATIAVSHGNGTPVGFIRALRRALSARAWDVIHVHAPQTALVLLATRPWLRRPGRLSSVYTVHNSFGNYKIRNRLLLIPILLAFRSIICCSGVAYQSLPRLFKWLAGSRLWVVQNGVDVDRVDRTLGDTFEGADRDAFSVVSVGQLIERKDPQCVLSAFAAADDGRSQLTFIGAGDLRERLAADIRARNLADRVHLSGLIPRTSVYQELSRADMFVSASRGEGLPVAVLEAMVCRCPVVLSDIPPHREIANGSDVIPLVRPGDAEGFARELARYRALSPREKVEIGRRCREIAVSRFSLQTMHAGYDAIYNRMLDGAGTTRVASMSEVR